MYRDGMAIRCVPDHLARDLWVKPDEKMIRLWCRAFAAQIDFIVDYQAWVVANFSGSCALTRSTRAIWRSCWPSIPRRQMAIVWSATPYCPRREVDQSMVKAFLERLRAAGLKPDEVITDDSRLYPSSSARSVANKRIRVRRGLERGMCEGAFGISHYLNSAELD